MSSTSRFTQGWRLQRVAPTRPSRLYAYASVLRESVGSHPVEVGWPDHETAVAQLRAALGEEAFAEAWAEGRAMTFGESLAYALAEEGA